MYAIKVSTSNEMLPDVTTVNYSMVSTAVTVTEVQSSVINVRKSSRGVVKIFHKPLNLPVFQFSYEFGISTGYLTDVKT
jgi:hypothetical protein